MNMRNISVCAILAMLLPACKIQNAPGAYLPAKGRVKVESMEPEKPIGQQKVVPTPAPDPVMVVDSQDERQPRAEYVEEPVLVVESVKEEPVVVAEPEKTVAEKFEVVGDSSIVLKKYHVVIGSFRSESNARNLQSQMRPDYAPVVVINERGMYRVILVSFDTYSETRRKVDAVMDQFPDAWVLVQKK